MRKPLPGFKPLKGLLLAICLSILAVLPATAAVTVVKPNITLPTSTNIPLSTLQDMGVISGLEELEDLQYTVSVSNTSLAEGDREWLRTSRTPGSFTATWTNDEGSSISINVTTLLSPIQYLEALPIRDTEIYVGETKTFQMPADCFPLKDYLEIKKGSMPGDYNLSVDKNTNTITVMGVKEGPAQMKFSLVENLSGASFEFLVKAKPTASDLANVRASIDILERCELNLKRLADKVDLGPINESNYYDYIITSEDSNLDYGRSWFAAKAPGKYVITFINSTDPSDKFNVEVIAKMSPTKYLEENVGTLFEGESKTIEIPDEYLTLSEFNVKVGSSEGTDEDEYLSVKVNSSNSITFTGKSPGYTHIFFLYKIDYYHGPNIGLRVLPTDHIVIKQPNIIAPVGEFVSLWGLMENGIVEGISNVTEYTVECDNSEVECSEYSFKSETPGNFTIKFSNNEQPGIEFELEVSFRNNPIGYIRDNLKSVEVGESKTITVPDEYIPLSEYESISLFGDGDVDPNEFAELELDTEKNQFTVTGKAKGEVGIEFVYRKFFSLTYAVRFTVTSMPNVSDIKTTPITVATWQYIDLPLLIENGAIEGLTEDDADNYSTSCESSDVECNYNFFRPERAGTYTIKYTHNEYPDVTFTLEVTVLNSFSLGFENIYEGQTKTVTVPDNCLPLSEYINFTLTPSFENPDIDPNSIVEFEVNTAENKIVFTGLKAGGVRFNAFTKYGSSAYILNVLEAPSADDIKVLEDRITIPVGTRITLSNLIAGGIVKGVPGTDDDYIISYSGNSSNVDTDNDKSYFAIYQPCTATITYTNKTLPDVKFSIIVVAKWGANFYVNMNLSTAYIGVPVTLTLPDDYIPLSNYTLEKRKDYKFPDADFNFSVEGNQLTVTGVAEGSAYLYFIDRFTTTYSTVNVSPKPSVDDIKVLKDLIIPAGVSIYAEKLMVENVVDGIALNQYDFSISSSDSKLVSCYSNAFVFNSTGTANITYTSKATPDLKVTVKVIAKENTVEYLKEQLSDALYVGESKSIVIPDQYLPLTYYTLESRQYGNDTKADFVTEMSENGMELTLIGKAAGEKNLYIGYYQGGPYTATCTKHITIKTREVKVEVNEEGTATAGTQIGVPVTVELPDDVSLEVEEGEKIVWESEDEAIATVDPETGEIVAHNLGVTYITVKKVPDTQAVALLSRTGDEEETLVTIEFWVTELLIDPEEITLKAGSREQLSYEVNAGDAKYPYDIKPTWRSANTSVATVEADGMVTAVGEGTAVITLSTTLGTKQTIVTVEPDDTPASTLSINPSSIVLAVGTRVILSASGNNGKNVIWSSSDASVAEVSVNGEITGISLGASTITATIEGTSIKASTSVTVIAHPSGIDETEAAEPVVTVANSTISVSGVASDTLVEIYAVSGRIIASRKGACSVAVANSGIYIVRIGAIARKVTVTR